MKTYSVITRCGVYTQYNALSTYEASSLARADGWCVLVVIPLLVKE